MHPETEEVVTPKYTETQAEKDRRATDFSYHPPKEDQLPRYNILRSYANEFCQLINETCPASRERSSALTKLDEVVMQANASIARTES